MCDLFPCNVPSSQTNSLAESLSFLVPSSSFLCASHELLHITQSSAFKMKVQLLLGALLPLVSAHFKLVYPAARGFDEDILGTFPCGGQNTVSSNRTEFPISGAPIQLLMGHTAAKVQVLMALGNDPGSNFNITLLPTVQEQGPQNFCIGAGALQFPASLNITAGMNATIQVVTNGDPSGGLYNVSIPLSIWT